MFSSQVMEYFSLPKLRYENSLPLRHYFVNENKNKFIKSYQISLNPAPSSILSLIYFKDSSINPVIIIILYISH